MITLEINETEIKLMEVEGRRVLKWGSLSLEAGLFEEGVVSDVQALGNAVKRLMVSSGISGRNVTASISGLYSLSRIVLVPNPPGGPTTEMVIDAAQEVMPLSEEDLYISWEGISAVEGSQQVLVVAVPRDVVDSEIAALKEAGINPRVLDLKGMALARAANRQQALILNIETSSFDIIMVAGGAIEAMRTRAWQSEDLTLDEKVEHLTVAIELAIGFYDSHHADIPFDRMAPLFITGQMSRDLALIGRLQSRVGNPVGELEPPLDYPKHLPVSQYAVNIGLALKGAMAPREPEQGGNLLPDLNLLPQAYKPWRPSTRQVYLFLALIVAFAFLLPAYQVTADAMDKTARLEMRYNAINSELQLRQEEIVKRQPLQTAIAQYNKIVNMGGGFTDDLKVVGDRAGELGVTILTITHSGDEISVNCEADTYIVFRDFLSSLEESGRFSSVNRPPERYEYLKSGTITLKPKH